MSHKPALSRIQHVGIIPTLRTCSTDEALFAAEATSRAGIPSFEIAATAPGAAGVIGELVKRAPELTVGAGSVLDVGTARQCVDAGAGFLSTDTCDPEIIEFAIRQGVPIFAGALTPTEVLRAWKAGADTVKVFPCAHMGGESYIRVLKTSFPQIPLIAAGGVSQQNATGYVLAGASALSIGEELIPAESIAMRQADRIRELARRFVKFVAAARKQGGARSSEPPQVAGSVNAHTRPASLHTTP